MTRRDYEKIDGSAYANIYAVGDLHGCYELFMRELESVKFDTTRDLVISVGDLIDRGPHSLSCLRLIRNSWFKAVKGNHESMAIEGLLGQDEHYQRLWLYNAGDWVLSLNPTERAEVLDLLKFCAGLPLVIELNDEGFKTVIAHADYPYDQYRFGRPLTQEQAVWERRRIEMRDETEIKGADAFIFGHTPLKRVMQLGNRLYIDTGAVFFGNLTLLRLK
ncbi:metallophosphoesterase [Basfia succiniciproducens]|uniref:metallophosphoesterase n=1 Tax=Basfia succiniciproducens TaxID=653940 RepID=UPI0008AB38A2|nr:metallophosphoesterase [Basfia succiniciproducens]SEP63460.1 serine/threonine protein phosphatase 1 [Basfia succiniciproducens]